MHDNSISLGSTRHHDIGAPDLPASTAALCSPRRRCRPCLQRRGRSYGRRARTTIRCRRGTTGRRNRRSSISCATTTDRASAKFVPPDQRIAAFDQDGTLWVEHPIYSQMLYCFDRVPALAAQKPALKHVEPFKTVLSGDREAIAEVLGAGAGKNHRRDPHRHDHRRLRRRSQSNGSRPPGPALASALYRTHLPADA